MTNFETGRLSDRHPPFRYSALSRVSFSDTDAQGVVYYGRYLPYFDSARLEYHRHLGLQVYWQSEHEFVMRSLEVTYEAPARFDELLDVHVRTTRIGGSSVTVEGAAYRVDDDRLMCTARMTLVLIDVATRGRCRSRATTGGRSPRSRATGSRSRRPDGLVAELATTPTSRRWSARGRCIRTVSCRPFPSPQEPT